MKEGKKESPRCTEDNCCSWGLQRGAWTQEVRSSWGFSVVLSMPQAAEGPGSLPAAIPARKPAMMEHPGDRPSVAFLWWPRDSWLVLVPTVLRVAEAPGSSCSWSLTPGHLYSPRQLAG